MKIQKKSKSSRPSRQVGILQITKLIFNPQTKLQMEEEEQKNEF